QRGRRPRARRRRLGLRSLLRLLGGAVGAAVAVPGGAEGAEPPVTLLVAAGAVQLGFDALVARVADAGDHSPSPIPAASMPSHQRRSSSYRAPVTAPDMSKPAAMRRASGVWVGVIVER